MTGPTLQLKQWHVYRVDQVVSRASTTPPQPLDDWRPYRRFVVIAPQQFVDVAIKITCIPIGEKSFHRLLHVPLPKGEARCTKDCHIWATEIYTLDRAHFDFEYGALSALKICELKTALRDYLDL
jgi:mRNA-degrading endonuclease toxin of MazEF toxin-antitoxin module